VPASDDHCPREWTDIDGVWAQASIALGGSPVVAARDGAILAAMYSQSHRRYHDGAHVRAVLRDSMWLADELGVDGSERHVLALAVCAHDVVYDARPEHDEAASAQWATSRLSEEGIAAAVIDRVSTLVLATADHHVETEDRMADALLDADLAILAAPRPEYLRYRAAVRAEYGSVTDDGWKRGRGEVLTALLDRPAIFRSIPARRRWEDAARRNIGTELRSMQAP